MIFNVQMTAEEISSADKANLQRFFTEALRAHRIGYHLLVVERAIVDKLLATLDLADVDKVMLRQLRAEFTQTADLVRRSTWHVRVRAGGPMRVVGNAVEIALDAACHPELFSRPLLLIEDEITDGKFYEFLLTNVREVLNLPLLKWETAHGGGERIIEVANQKIRDGRIVCAIYDTDVQSPLGYESKKARELRELGASSSWKLFFPIPTPGREIENIVPLEVVSLLQCAHGNGAAQSVLFDLASRERQAGHDASDVYWLHFDIKLGCSHENLAKACCAEELRWLQRKLSLVVTDLAAFHINGYGANVVPLLLDTGYALSEFRRLMRANWWLELFKDFILRFAWVFAGGVHHRT
ncbi:hypothetical protein [Bradyrhizobium zhanjiangense]|uniref:Uncharacterized protein n=1 Tax=Bradyrhizobium zhanjiangense TaxID=1325107 RepID=A0A4V1L379_9BRAD|nr:hypothetical protein [Bradyrhizobium zhanjiangense]RXH37033.1 hypothetical protein XH94_24375 [Bradyrhizobium zhanjiangense]